MNAPACVYCRQAPVDPRWRPFCSERCKLFDLAAWAGGQYRVPAAPVEDAREDNDDETS